MALIGVILLSGALPSTTLRTPNVFADGPLSDPLDSLPLRWRLGDADCPVEVAAHWLDPTAGPGGRPCEALRLRAGHGTRVEFEYRLEPSRLIEDIDASLAVWSVNDGPRLGIRVRYPRIIDPLTRAPIKLVLYGDGHKGRGVWERLSARPTTAALHVNQAAIRRQYGSDVDFSDAYVDAVILNAYTGAGQTTVRLDDLRVAGLVSVDAVQVQHSAPDASLAGASLAGASVADASTQSPLASGTPAMTISERGAASSHSPSPTDPLNFQTPRNLDAGSDRSSTPRANGVNRLDPQRLSIVQSAFTPGRVTRIIEYRGEPLELLKMFGFDAILLTEPATASVLREAAREDLQVYAPPPLAVKPTIEPWLSAIQGWYLGSSVDATQLDYAARQASQLDALPALWRRPALVAPAEGWDRYAGIATSMVYDLPLPLRQLTGLEEADYLRDQLARTGRPVVAAVGVACSPPERLTRQLDAIARQLGGAPIGDYGWRDLTLQAWRGMGLAPRAIVYRSTSPLSSGDEHDARRGSVISWMNAWLEVLGPLISQTHPLPHGVTGDGRYLLAHLDGPRDDLVIATAHASGPSNAGPSNASENQPLVLPIRGTDNLFAWRITDTTVEQLPLNTQLGERSAVIENPDRVELVVCSGDATAGGRILRRLRASATMIQQQRWQLTQESLSRTRADWRAAVSGGLVPRTAAPYELLQRAAQQLLVAQPAITASDFGSASRAIRAADAMCFACETMLRNRLRPTGTATNGMPTLLAPGGVMLHVAWLPGIEDGTWSRNLLAAGAIDDADRLPETGWSYETRREQLADVTVDFVPAGGELGSGALRMEASGRGPTPLPGGYAGTVARVSSAPVQTQPGQWLRIRVRAKTLGFGGPHQGLLIYDSETGSELGQLLSGQPSWTTIELFRLVTNDRPFRVIFETIGGGEALVDWVRVEQWQPPTTPPPLRPIAPRD